MASVREIENHPQGTARRHPAKAALLASAAAMAMGLMIGLTAATPALADDAPTFMSTVKVSGSAEIGATFNSDTPTGGVNYGHLFTDRSNQLMVNQLIGTIYKDPDANAEGISWGFKLQGMYGSDARYTHFLGELDTSIKERTQLDIIEANVALHIPMVANGLDVKIGQYATPVGYEVIPAAGNPFYTHSYIFNFGLPFKHTGALATLHLSPEVDLYGGLDSGTNTSLGDGDNNGAVGGIFGLGLNLFGGKVAVVALSHVGPENPSLKAPLGVANANNENRWINDIVTTIKVTDDLTLVTDLNYIKDDLYDVDAGGVAQYVSYALTPEVTLNLRGELFRDGRGFFVAGFTGNTDFVNIEKGYPTTGTILGTGVGTTYSEITLGATWKPANLGMFDGLTVRPEVRYDHAMADRKAYDNLTKSSRWTFGLDLVMPFGG